MARTSRGSRSVAIDIASAIEYIIAKALIYLIQSYGPSGRGALLAQNVEQSELRRRDAVGAIPANQRTVPSARPKLYLPYRELQAIAILKQLLKR
jgi:hypothetical protein